MTWKQLVSPNLDPYIKEGGVILTDWLGWCLAYAKTAYGAFGNTGNTAWKAWGNCQFRHTDELPIGVYVPIWFSGYGGLGHVSILYRRPDNQIQIWSSPISHKPYADVWGSIGEVERRYGVTYAGWSEDIAGVKVIELTNDGVETVNDDSARQIGYHYLGRNGFDGKPNALASPQADLQGKPLTNAQLQAWFLSAESKEWRDSRLPSVYSQRDSLNAQVASLQNQINDLVAKTNQQQKEIADLQDANSKLTEENKALKAQLAQSGSDSIHLNALGELLNWFIVRLGLKG